MSEYSAFNNDPILFVDPLGDIVKLKRGDDVSRAEFRKYKREVRTLRRNSETFGAVYNDLNNDAKTYTFTFTKESGGGMEDLSRPFDYKIGMNLKYDGLNLFQSNLSEIAHEFGHTWRTLYNLDPKTSFKMPAREALKVAPLFATAAEKAKVLRENSQIEEDNRLAGNAFAVQYQFGNRTAEEGASHIQNIVLSELMKVPLSVTNVFSGIILRETYDHGVELNNYKIDGKTYIGILPGIGTYNLLVPPHDRSYYMNNKIDIHKEYGVPSIKR